MLTILVPCAGEGKRFKDAGHWLPKPLIRVGGVPMVQKAVRNVIDGLYKPNRVVAVARHDHLQVGLDEALRNSFGHLLVVPVDGVTAGAAATCLTARHLIDRDDPLMVVNCDQYIDGSEGNLESLFSCLAGCGEDPDAPPAAARILTFPGDGSRKWSYARYDTSNRLVGVAEKEPVSNRATTGHYWFRRGSDFVKAVDRMLAAYDRTNG
jgi:NDP-sugar pyrophosphorylase family protein